MCIPAAGAALELLLNPLDLVQVSNNQKVITMHCHLDVPLLVHEVAAGRSAPVEPDLDQELGVCGRPNFCAASPVP